MVSRAILSLVDAHHLCSCAHHHHHHHNFRSAHTALAVLPISAWTGENVLTPSPALAWFVASLFLCLTKFKN